MEDKQSHLSQANDFAKQLLAEIKTIDANNKTKSMEDLTNGIGSAIRSANYTDAIFLLMEKMDLDQGIHTYQVHNQINNHQILIRDGRKASPPIKDATEPYIIMALNYARAVRALLSKEEYEPIKDIIDAIVQEFYIQGKQQKTFDDFFKLFKHFNSVLVSQLAQQLKVSFDEAKKRLITAKDFTNFEAPSRDIVTLTNLKDKNEQDVTVFQADLAVTALTKELIEEYENREGKIWHDQLEPWKQQLIKRYYENIKRQDCIIPTQLRSILIGLRNTYQTINGLFPTDTDEPKVVTRVFRSGTLVYLGKNQEENQRIDKLHGEQLKQATKADTLLAVTLNTSVNIFGNDNTIVNDTKFIAEETGGLLHSNLPLNTFRRISPNTYGGVNSILEITAEHIVNQLTVKDKYKDLAAPHISDPNDQAFLEEIKNYLTNKSGMLVSAIKLKEKLKIFTDRLKESTLNPEEKQKIENLHQIIKRAITVRYLMDHNKSLFDTENRNLVIASDLNIIITEMQNYIDILINSSCESGKDREGILMFRTAILAFTKYLFETYDLRMHDNITRLANTGHQQYLAGCPQGGTTGARGVKEDSQGAISTDEFPKAAIEALIQKPAAYNKKIPTLKKGAELIYFPISKSSATIQRNSIIQTLKMHGTNNKVINQQLQKTIKELEQANTLSALKSILKKSANSLPQPSLLNFYTESDTLKLINVINQNLTSVIQKIVEHCFTHWTMTEAIDYLLKQEMSSEEIRVQLISLKANSKDIDRCFRSLSQSSEQNVVASQQVH